MHPAVAHQYIHLNGNGQFCTCALTAAAVATGLLEKYSLADLWRFDEASLQILRWLTDRFDIDDNPAVKVPCPVENCHFLTKPPPNLFHYVLHLSDDHNWSREAIADQLESIGY